MFCYHYSFLLGYISMVDYKYNSETKMVPLLVKVWILLEHCICIACYKLMMALNTFILFDHHMMQYCEITRADVIMFDRQQNQNHE